MLSAAKRLLTAGWVPRRALLAAILTLPLSAQETVRKDPAGTPPPSNRRGIDVLSYRFTIDLREPGDTLVGRANISVRRTAGTSLLTLDLLKHMVVDDVRLDGRPIEFMRDDTTIGVPLGAASDSFEVTVSWRGVPTDGLVIRRDSLGRRTAFGDNWPNRARHWLPTVDHPSDKALVTWQVVVPRGMTVVANGIGRQYEVRPASGAAPYQESRWDESRPIPTYLMVVAIAPLVETPLAEAACGLAERAPCVPQSVYTAPELKSYAPGPFVKAPAIVEFFARLVGPYPYEKLAHLQSSTRFGGMENASAIFYSDNAFRRRSVGVSLIAHETAHQWFGNSVTEREWGHLWLSEGFATYFAQLWAENDMGSDSLRAGMTRARAQVLAAAEAADRPVIDTTQTDLMELLNANSYQKGGFVLHMLRAEIGDSAFFRGVRSYYAEFRHSTALSADFQRHMERSSGRSLSWFFDQWLRRPGFAAVETRWRYDQATSATVVDIEQTGRHGSFRFPLVVEVDDGERATRSVVQVAARPRTTASIASARAPRRVTFDPDAQVLAAFTNR